MDRKQVQHDLALAYAKAKLQISLERGELAADGGEEPARTAHALLGWYRDCMYELANIKDKEFLDFWSAGLE